MNYKLGESIQVYITERGIDIVNYNRPLPPVTLEDLDERTFFKERDAVNPEIRDMFKALGIIESYGTGVGEAKRACQNSGSGSIYYKIFPNNADVTSVVIRISDEFCELTNENMETVAENKETDGEEKGTQDAWKAVRQQIRGSDYSSKISNNMDKLLLEFKDSPFTPKDIRGIAAMVKGRYAFYFPEPGKKDPVEAKAAAARTPAYWQCKNAFRSVAPDMTDEEIVKAKGHVPAELYRLASGASEILGHSTSKMTPKGRDRSRRNPIQLRLDMNFWD